MYPSSATATITEIANQNTYVAASNTAKCLEYLSPSPFSLK